MAKKLHNPLPLYNFVRDDYVRLWEAIQSGHRAICQVDIRPFQNKHTRERDIRPSREIGTIIKEGDSAVGIAIVGFRGCIFFDSSKEKFLAFCEDRQLAYLRPNK